MIHATVPIPCPVSYLPRRARSPRDAYLRTDAAVAIARTDPSDAPLVLVHRGQGRSQARPIHRIGGDLFTPVMRWEPDGTDHGGRPVPASLASILARSPSGMLGLAASDRSGHTAICGSPLMARSGLLDRKIVDDARVPTIEAGALAGAAIAYDGRPTALAALHRHLAGDVRIVGDALLVRMAGPLVHLAPDRATLTATLNPGLVDLAHATIPVFAPLHDAPAFLRYLADERVVRGGVADRAPALDHLDPNPAAPPDDLADLPRPAGAERDAALATATLAPAFSLSAVRRVMAFGTPGNAAELAPLREPLLAAWHWARLGHFGPYDPADVMDAALRLLDRAVATRPDLVSWNAPAYALAARRWALPHLSAPTPPEDAYALAGLAP